MAAQQTTIPEVGRGINIKRWLAAIPLAFNYVWETATGRRKFDAMIDEMDDETDE